jgi:hypothetical protein
MVSSSEVLGVAIVGDTLWQRLANGFVCIREARHGCPDELASVEAEDELCSSEALADIWLVKR